MSGPSPTAVPGWISACFESAPFGVIICTADRRIVFLNRWQEWNSGLHAEDAVGRPLKDVFGRAVGQFRAEFEALVERREPFRRTFRNYRRATDGRVVSFTITGYRVDEWIVFTTSIDDELHEILRESERFAENVRTKRSLLELGELLVTPTSQTTVLEAFVHKVPTMIGATRAVIGLWHESPGRHEAVAGFGLDPAQIRALETYPIDSEPWARRMREANDEIFVGNAKTSRRFSERFLEIFDPRIVLLLPLRWRDTYLGFLGMCRDTEYSDEELELSRGSARLLAAAIANARLLDAALESSRLKSAFLANVSHELRTPLNVILGYTGILADHLEELGDSSQDPIFQTIHRASRRLLRTVNTILDFSRLEAGSYPIHRRPLLLGPMLSDVVGEATEEAQRKRIGLRLVNAEPAAQVTFDENCLKESLTQLVDNAIKFTNAGEVVMSLGRGDDGSLVLDVRDTGIGIAPDYLPRLFQPFTQADLGSTRRYEGSGLGLALAQKLIERNGGELSVESIEGQGSVFRIRFAA